MSITKEDSARNKYRRDKRTTYRNATKAVAAMQELLRQLALLEQNTRRLLRANHNIELDYWAPLSNSMDFLEHSIKLAKVDAAKAKVFVEDFRVEKRGA